ncbi:MAG TPA: DJ-1/PfpI family protein [bacterium]|jgi:transcriptional regulator GlxA family with amidase domain|nr:DJ-1/PfpI family protein [bacterium]
MKIGFVIYGGMTSLDFVGVYDPLTRLKIMGFLPDLSWDICSLNEWVTDSTGLTLKATVVSEPLGNYDLVIVPGGPIGRDLSKNEIFIQWIKTMESCPLKVSVCSGSLLLGAAGFLKGKKATIHPTRVDDLAPYCARVISQRVVDEGSVITAGGVTAAIDLGLYLCEKLSGPQALETIKRQMDYHGSW